MSRTLTPRCVSSILLGTEDVGKEKWSLSSSFSFLAVAAPCVSLCNRSMDKAQGDTQEATVTYGQEGQGDLIRNLRDLW